MIKLKQLEFFRAVMLYGSINRAAHYLCVSQPVVSRTIALLERSIELELFERKSSHLVPTRNAYILHRYCDEIFAKTNQLSYVIKSLKSEQERRLKFCASPALSNFFVPRLLAQFDESVRIHFETAMLKDVAVNVESGLYEFGLTIWPILSENLECRPLAESSFVFLCHKSNPLHELPAVGFEHLTNQEFIFTNRSMPIGEYIERKFEEMKVHCEKYIEVDRSEVVCSLINAGRGVSIINQHGFEAELWTNVREVELKQPIYTHIYLVRLRSSKLSKEADAFIDFLTSESARFVGA
ncbi:LysR family transcriptional regulator [Allopusillimonas ginsengisoli]|nr:LysR family transcriptional regulator [Allopusillimonas ginsengisoli]